MRMLAALAPTLVLVSLATISAAPQTRTIPAPSDVVAPLPGAKNTGAQNPRLAIDSSKVKFVLVTCRKDSRFRLVFGVVAKEIDLSQDDIAKQILEQGARFGQDRCPVPLGRDAFNTATGQFENIKVMLRRGDPATLTDDKFYVRGPDPNNYFDRPDIPRLHQLEGAYPDAVVSGRNYAAENFQWREYENLASIARYEAAEISRVKDEEKRRQQLYVQQIKAAAQQKAMREQSESAARNQRLANRQSIVRRLRIDVLVSGSDLRANPFPYKGKVVGVFTAFSAMRDANSAWFDNQSFLVLGVPSTRFPRPADVLLAGRVLGTQQVTIFGTEVTVPKLQFVDAYSCQQSDCRELNP